MLSRNSKIGKLVYRDQDKGVIVAVFDNKNKKGKRYGKVLITALQGKYKQTFWVSIPEFERLRRLIAVMPEIQIKQKKQ